MLFLVTQGFSITGHPPPFCVHSPSLCVTRTHVQRPHPCLPRLLFLCQGPAFCLEPLAPQHARSVLGVCLACSLRDSG